MLVLFISSCSSCVQLQRASSLGGLNKENSPLKSVNRSVNESGAVRKRTAGIALGEQENCPSALTATPTKNSLCSPSTKVDNWPNTVNYSLHDAPQVLCVTKCGILLPEHLSPLCHLVYYILICFAEISKFMLVRSIVQCSQEYRKGNYSSMICLVGSLKSFLEQPSSIYCIKLSTAVCRSGRLSLGLESEEQSKVYVIPSLHLDGLCEDPPRG